MFRVIPFCLLAMFCTGCSSLGLSLYPSGHFLTDQTEQVLDQSRREANLAKELSKDVLPVHYLEPGDVLLIEPVDFNSKVRIPADQHVLADGSVDLGGFGRAVVAGLPLEAAENLIEKSIVDGGGEETEINLRLLEASHRYYVLGEVNSPGAYPLKGNENVLDGILAAGGITGDASPCKLLLARPTEERSCRITLPICYREITQLGDSSTNYQLRPGDRIYVASRSFCEELMCCLATETCDRCCKYQRACANPSWIPFRNVYTRVADDRSESIWQNRAANEGSEPYHYHAVDGHHSSGIHSPSVDDGSHSSSDLAPPVTAMDLREPGVMSRTPSRPVPTTVEELPQTRPSAATDSSRRDGQLRSTDQSPRIPDQFPNRGGQ
ncbi:MAG: sugar transporter [Pirellulaceae bacterium]|nr:sugar transporter [Pirellulaceae bacterium]